jgi:1-acyl-sn-glycerol-3-phosphate acyltransferase
MEDDRFVLRSMTDEILYELMLLGGQEYVDIYASKAKADLAKRRADERASDVPAGRPRLTSVPPARDGERRAS